MTEEVIMTIDGVDIIQGHTMQINKLKNGKYQAQCLTCKFHFDECDLETQAYKDMGYHFGRLSTRHSPYGTYKGENK